MHISNNSSLVDGMSPFWIRAQVKHGHAPRVHGQRDREDAQDVHDEACFHLRERKHKDMRDER